ncbi:MAG: hypothetical protein ONB46_05580 [candidate division KSB1 bacterium]|nr:hypothetical protein [candidate division KSB1 bacterium]MDZ7365423.1 hypothetical protein [candidate division KSB1 bacterium]MDZ7403530.1 hypothetical protein [candidate division KSB1 bacterium]
MTDAATDVLKRAGDFQDILTEEPTSRTDVHRVDLGIAWEWEYDAEFVGKLERACKGCGLSVCIVNPTNVANLTARYFNEKIFFRYYLDRGSDARREFERLAQLVASGETHIINHYRYLRHCLDKATMHLEFLTAGLNVPYTIILSPYKTEPEIKITDLARLGRSFIIKPAVGGGGAGVVVGAETLADVLKARQSQHDQKFLLQEKIEPAILGGERAWFRVYYVLGQTFLTWWNDITHVYRRVEPTEEIGFYLSPMRTIIKKIAQVSRLDFFSAEIALTANGRFVVVDYVNDICDMRLQSRHPDGVPDRVIDEIVAAITNFVMSGRFYGTLDERNPAAI